MQGIRSRANIMEERQLSKQLELLDKQLHSNVINIECQEKIVAKTFYQRLHRSAAMARNVEDIIDSLPSNRHKNTRYCQRRKEIPQKNDNELNEAMSMSSKLRLLNKEFQIPYQKEYSFHSVKKKSSYALEIRCKMWEKVAEYCTSGRDRARSAPPRLRELHAPQHIERAHKHALDMVGIPDWLVNKPSPQPLIDQKKVRKWREKEVQLSRCAVEEFSRSVGPYKLQPGPGHQLLDENAVVSMEFLLSTLKAGLPVDRHDNHEEDEANIPTVLSCNPNQYEKKLRKIVQDLYSDDKMSSLDEYVLRDNISSDEKCSKRQVSSTVEATCLNSDRTYLNLSEPLSASFDGTFTSEDIVDPRILYRFKESVVGHCEVPSSASILIDSNDHSGHVIGSACAYHGETSDRCSEPELNFSNDSGVHLECFESGSRSSIYNEGTSSPSVLLNHIKPGSSRPSDHQPAEHENDSKIRFLVANMEGKLDSLTSEYKKVLLEKNELEEKLKNQQCQVKSSSNDSAKLHDMQHELKSLRAKQTSLNDTISKLKKLHCDKDIKLCEAEEKFNASQLCLESVQTKLQLLEKELLGKDNGLKELETELLTLNTTLENTRMIYEELLQEKQILSSDVETLANAKSWLIKQLEKSSQSQTDLQEKLYDSVSRLQAQNHQVEHLKRDNLRVTEILTTTQNATISDKKFVLDQLEKVESNLLSKDIAYKSLQSEKNLVQRELGAKIESLEKEKNLLQKLADSALNLEKELKQLQVDAKSKENLIQEIRNEKEMADGYLHEARRANDVCREKIKTLNEKRKGNENEIKLMNENQVENEKSINDLKSENKVLMLKVQQAEEEKVALDNAVRLLRHELDKVERRFNIMKREVSSKGRQLEEVTQQKDGFIKELRVLRDELEQHKELMNELRNTISSKEVTVRELQSHKMNAVVEVRSLKEDLERTRNDMAELEAEKIQLYQQFQTARSDLSKAEKNLLDSCSQKAKLEGELESTNQVLRENTNIQNAAQKSLKDNIEQLECNLRCEETRHRDEAIILKQEIEFLRTNQTKEDHKHKTKIKNLQEQLLKLEELHREQCKERRTEYDTMIKLSLQKIEQEKAHRNQEVEQLNLENKCLTIKYTELEQRAKYTATMLQNRINELENELDIAKSMIIEQKDELEKLLLISVDLEREKGRFAGLQITQNTLRDHCASVEKLSANRETKIVQLQTKLSDVTNEKNRQQKEAQSKLHHFESMLKTKGEKLEEVQSILEMKTKESVELKFKLNSSEQETEETKRKHAKAEVELEKMRIKYNDSAQKCKISEELQEECRSKLQNTTTKARILENESRILKEKEKVQDTVSKAMELKLGQCSKELEYAKEQLRLCNERQQCEVENMKTAVKVAKSESTYLRKELFIVRKAGQENKEKYFKSRDEVISSRKDTQVVKQDLFTAMQQLHYLKSAILNSRDLQELQDLVRNEDYTPSVTMVIEDSANQNVVCDSSLASLRECMSSLRSQISILQDQMDGHTESVDRNVSSWRCFEKNVQTLQSELNISKERHPSN